VRINPSVKKKFKQALRDNDIEYILREGLRQEDSGAHILDVNVGLPEIDEPSMMASVVQKLQSVLDLPLQIDTTDAQALERGMRIYNGKPMVNSVNGKRESIETVFPLVRKYGGVLVALVLDEDGIPSDAEGRVRIARRIYEAADRYGVPREDIVIDGLAMTISSDTTSALTTLETLRRVRDELHGHTILGVSNISFGLPRRALINSHFLTMALQSGLSAAIMNPGNEEMMESYRAYCALAGLDPQCMRFIEAYGGTPEPVRVSAAGTAGGNSGTGNAGGSGAKNAGSTGAMGLFESVERGMAESAAAAAREALKSKEPLVLIDQELIPALDKVGKGFEKGTVFLPQLLMSAEAAKAAFDVVKETLQGQSQEVKGRIILATVKGDIHDIGKNIVKVMLENYGFEVLDLGKDVSPETIAETAVREDIRLVGLSALMTTTVVSMEETIRLLHEVKPDVKTVVGGAVMTQEYADAIHADCYAKDAMATVHFAEEVFKEG
jgi:5-methyltetrahydrofolate--homocysteine methyltransferase